MPLSSDRTSSTRIRVRRASSHSPSRHRNDNIDDNDVILPSTSSKPIRRGRKPGTKRRVVKPSTPDFDNSFNNSLSSLGGGGGGGGGNGGRGGFHNSFSGMPSEPAVVGEELDFLTKSPAGHQWRNKKLWQTNANLTQKRYEEFSGKKSLVATPQGMERELRRKDIRDALMGAMDGMGVPDL